MLKYSLQELCETPECMTKVRNEATFCAVGPCAYENFLMLNSAEHEISKLDKSNLIKLFEKFFTFADLYCFYLSNKSFEFNLPYSFKDKLGF